MRRGRQPGRNNSQSGMIKVPMLVLSTRARAIRPSTAGMVTCPPIVGSTLVLNNTERSCHDEGVPKVVDHTERRREIAEAVWRVLMRDGLRGASVRAVVAESGLSSGAIRHYFSSHDDLLRFAGHVVVERGPDRILSVLRNRRVGPRRRATLLLEELIPLDHQRQTETRVFAGLADLDRARPADREFRRNTYEGCRVIARMAVLLLAGEEVTSEPVTPLRAPWERLAERLQVVTDGLAGQYLFYPGLHNPAAMSRILRRAVDDVSDELADRDSR